MKSYPQKSKIFNSIVVITFIIVALFPFTVSAQSQSKNCLKDGYSVFVINGIFTNEEGVKKDKQKLEEILPNEYKKENVKVDYLYNPSHLAGAGDLIQTASQIVNFSLNNYDLQKILLDLHSQLKTQKILLVGYSQGTLYANEIYNYLINNGVSKDAIAVYNIATPASFVAGDGEYLTSINDKVVNFVRETALKIGITVLPANIDIPLTPEQAAQKWGGHSFSDVYLAQASRRIVSEIESSLVKLKAADNFDTARSGCFILPQTGFLFAAQDLIFAATDPFIKGVVNSISFTYNSIKNAFHYASDAIIGFFNTLFSTIKENLPNLAATPYYMEDITNIKEVKSGKNLNSINDINESGYKQTADSFKISDNDSNSNLTQKKSDTTFKNDTLGNLFQTTSTDNFEKLSQEIYAQSWQFYNYFYAKDLKNKPDDTKLAQNYQINWPSSLVIPGQLTAPLETVENSDAVNTADIKGTIETVSAGAVTQIDDRSEITNTSEIKESSFKDKILINEIYWKDNNDSNEIQWIELKNVSQEEINLKNWSLSWSDYKLVFKESDKIAPDKFFLLEYKNDELMPLIAADKIFDKELKNTGEKIILADNEDLIVDTADFSLNWLEGQNKFESRSIQRKDLSLWDLYLSDGKDENCLSKITDKNNKTILGTPKQENDFALATYTGATIIQQDSIIKNQNYWCSRKSPYIIEFSEYSHPIVDTEATVEIEPGTEIIFKNITPPYSGTYGYNVNRRHIALEIKGKFIAQGNAGKYIKIALDQPFEFSKNYLDILTFKESSSGVLSYLDFNATVDKPVSLNLFNLESSDFLLENSKFKAYTLNYFINAINITRAVGPTIINNSFEGFYYPIFIQSSGEVQNGQNIYLAPILKNNSGQNNYRDGIIIFSGNGLSTTIGKDWTLYENDVNFHYYFGSNLSQYFTVLKGATLKIMPGVKILPLNCKALFYQMHIFGAIEALGTKEKPILFTSACQNPEPGDWQGIWFYGGSGTFKNTKFLYGGADQNIYDFDIRKSNEMVLLQNDSNAIFEDVEFSQGAGVGLEISNSTATIKNTDFKLNKYKHIVINNPVNKTVFLENVKIDDKEAINSIGIDIYSGNVEIVGAEIKSNKSIAIQNRAPAIYYPGEKTTLSLENVSISDANIPIYQENYNDIIISIKNITLTNNNYNGIYVSQNYLNYSINKEVPLQNEIPYIIVAQAVIDNGGKLIVKEGTIFKIAWGWPLPVFQVKSGGTLEMLGTLEKPIFITDIRDDTFGGDTNNDSNQSQPTQNSWKAIKFENASSGVLKNVKIKYSQNPALEILSDASVTQENVEIIN